MQKNVGGVSHRQFVLAAVINVGKSRPLAIDAILGLQRPSLRVALAFLVVCCLQDIAFWG